MIGGRRLGAIGAGRIGSSRVGGHVLVSAELRWFWSGGLPAAVDAWFRNAPFPPGGGRPRTDEYLVDRSQIELGVKKRGTKAGVEMKGLVAPRRTVSVPFAGRVQIWTKWTSEALTIDGLSRVAVEKSRWLRKYDTSGPALVEIELDDEERPRWSPDELPERGCHFEVVLLRVNRVSTPWASVGFEAFGELSTVEDSLDRTLRHVAPETKLPAGRELSYPAWLAGL
jgi:hypothetical protein